jgi:segregation and condensation protein B
MLSQPLEDWTLDGNPDAILIELPPAVPVPPPVAPIEAAPPPRRDAASPPPADRIAEAILFTGGTPLTPEAFAAAVRVPPDTLRTVVDTLNRKYRTQNRPYTIQPQQGGYVLVVKPMYRSMREKLFGGPRETRLSPTAVDVVSLVAYRQPITKDDIDAVRGHDSGTILRQLVRLGLIAVTKRGEVGQPETYYGTTPRFLDVFGLNSLDDLPRLGESQLLS